MNSLLESIFASWLTQSTLDRPVYTGSSSEEFNLEQLAVIVVVPEIEHSVGPLHKATVNLIVSAPAYHATVESYRGVAATLRSLVEDHANGGLSDEFESANFDLGGIWIKDSSERIEEDRWVHSLALTVGVIAR